MAKKFNLALCKNNSLVEYQLITRQIGAKKMRNKGVALLLCLFLGGLGVHKFYLGENAWGIIYLIFCWTFIPSILAFLDLFILVFMSDQDFNRKFNNMITEGYSGGAISAKDATSALYDLKKLYEQGVITAEEYEQKRRKMLDKL